MWLAALIASCVPLHLFWRLFGKHSPWPQRFLGGCARAVGVKATVVGERATGTALFAANHQSWMDILLIGGATGASFVSKASVRKWPIAGWLATMVGTIYIENSDRAGAVTQAATIRQALHDGKSVAFFPEGHLDNGKLKPFRPALFGSVVPPEQPVAVQPIALDYGRNSRKLIWRSGSHAGTNAVEIMKRRGTEAVTIHLLAPVYPRPDSHRRDLARQCEDAISAALGQEPENAIE